MIAAMVAAYSALSFPVSGTPTVAAEPAGKLASYYREIALNMAAQLSRLPVSNSIPGVVQVKNE